MTKRKPGSTKTLRFSNDEFESRVTATLEAQDRLLERLEEKLEKPVLNGGFDTLVAKVEKIDAVTEALRDSQEVANAKIDATSAKIDAIHKAVYDPDTGLYPKVKENSAWITNVNKGFKWLFGLVVAGMLTGVGKLLYDFATTHVHIAR